MIRGGHGTEVYDIAQTTNDTSYHDMYHSDHKYSTNIAQFELKTTRIAGVFAEFSEESGSGRGRQLLALGRNGTIER